MLGWQRLTVRRARYAGVDFVFCGIVLPIDCRNDNIPATNAQSSGKARNGSHARTDEATGSAEVERAVADNAIDSQWTR